MKWKKGTSGCHPRGRGDPVRSIWIPAFAGMTLIIFLLASCGSADMDSGVDGAGILAIRVEGADVFSPNIEHGRVDKFRVTVRGEGIDEDIVAEFSSDAEEGVVEGVPTGDGREVIVEAVNSNDAVIRAGEAMDVNVGGGVTDVSIDLESVPIFANLKDGAVVRNSRFVMRIFSDPSHPVAVEEISGEGNFSLVDAATSLPEIHTNDATWLGSFSPRVLPVGEYQFVVRDLSNERSSTINVRLLDGERMQPATFAAAVFADETISLSILSISENISRR